MESLVNRITPEADPDGKVAVPRREGPAGRLPPDGED
jgi:hypothetical protein